MQQPKFFKYYLVSLYVFVDVIIIFNDWHIFYDDMYLRLQESELGEFENPYIWMYERSWGKLIDMVDYELYFILWKVPKIKIWLKRNKSNNDSNS